MLATNHSSAGSYSAENDRSQRIAALSTSVGAIVGRANRGPVNERTLITDKEILRTTFGIKNPKLGKELYCAEDFLEEASRLYYTRVAKNALYGGVKLSIEDNFLVLKPVAEGFEDPSEISLAPSDIALLHGVNPGAWNNDLRIVMYPDTDDLTNSSAILRIYEGESTIAIEEFSVATKYMLAGNGNQMYIESVIDNSSDVIGIVFNEDNAALALNEDAFVLNSIVDGVMTGGDNGGVVNDSDIMLAWDLYADWEKVTINMMINAGWTSQHVHRHMDMVATQRQDCIAILDMPSNEQAIQDAVNYRRNTLNLNTSYSAMYTPDLLVRDYDNGVDVWVPQSGKVAAQYALTDRVSNAWFAPAGFTRGSLTGVKALREEYNLGMRDMATENQINTIRSITGNGTVIWGADTMYSQPSSLNDIGARRLLCMLHGAVRINSLFPLYEPGDSLLRAKMTQEGNDLLQPIMDGRGLYWFEVICDERNNPNNYIANGDMVIDYYLDITRFTKRIHINANVAATGQIDFAASLVEKS